MPPNNGGVHGSAMASGAAGMPLAGNGSARAVHARVPSSEMIGASIGNPQRLGLPKRLPSVGQQLDDWVAGHNGTHPIHSVLVANNGLAAVKFMRSVRSWASQALGHPRAVSLIAMATPNDMRVNAEHISLADQFVEVPGGTNNNNYANVPLIVRVARAAGVGAVWPGWGHASENPELPAALTEAGITFLGPPAPAMAALGDKIGSTILAQAAGVPTLPWSGSGVAVGFEECAGGEIPSTVYQQACLPDVESAVTACETIGFPVMLKASWGGGGKGIRKVNNREEVRSLYRQVAGEVPGSPIFAMKLAPASRHLEVQLLCDTQGNVASLRSRDCSVQRRHQKIIEEGPVTAAPPETVAAMERAARALARSVRYVGAATVEFLYCIDEQAFYFLELNPRLQVEHPVTEGITGVNIPACQLLIGMGLPLWAIPEMRALYGQPAGPPCQPFNFENTPQKPVDSHVVAVRITAEDAADGFKPTAGRIDELFFRPTPEVWGYFSVKSGGAIHEYSDSQFGHLFARGPSRAAALRSLAVALSDVVVRGEIRTIVDYALGMLQSPDIVNNRIHTGWLDSRIALKLPGAQPPWHLAVIAGAVVRAHQAVTAQTAEYLGFLSKGQLPPATVSLVTFTDAIIIGGNKYCVEVTRRGSTALTVSLNGSAAEVTTRKMADGGFLLQVDGESHVVHVEEEASGTRLALGPTTCLLAQEADPSRIVATSTGKLVRYLVPSGSHVVQHTPFAEVEVMKMMMPLLAPAAGVVQFLVPEGANLSPGTLIGRLDLDDPLAVVRAEVFTGTFPDLGPPVLPSTRPDQQLKAAVEAARAVLAGYVQPVDRVVAQLVACLDVPSLAACQWGDEMSVVRTRLPQPLVAALDAVMRPHEEALADFDAAVEAAERSSGGGAAGADGVEGDCSNGSPARINGGMAGLPPGLLQPPEFPAGQLLDALNAAVESADPSERAALSSALEPLRRVASRHTGGQEGHARTVVQELLDEFLATEEKFQLGGGGNDGPSTEQEAIDAMRKVATPGEVLDAVLSHQGLPRKTDLVCRLLAALVLPAPGQYRPQLRRLAGLAGGVKGAATVAARAAALLEHSLLGDLRVVVARALSGLDMFSATPSAELEPITGPPAPATPSAGSAITPSDSGVSRGPTLAAPPGDSLVEGRGDVRRAATNVEGLFLGLPPGLVNASRGVLTPATTASPPNSLLLSPGSLYSPRAGGATATGPTSPAGIVGGSARRPGHVSRVATAAVENKMDMLVSVPAAVEAALDSLITDPAVDPTLQARAALTLVRRLHTPFLLSEPHLTHHAASGALRVSWVYDSPAAANTPTPRIRAGVLLVVNSLTQLSAALAGPPSAGALGDALSLLGMPAGPVTLHVALSGDLDAIIAGAPAGEEGTAPPVPVVDTCGEGDTSATIHGDPSTPSTLALLREAVAGFLSQHTRVLRAHGTDTMAVVGLSPRGTLPVRLGYTWAPAPSDGTSPEAGHFARDRVLSHMDPVTAQLLELRRLSAYPSLHYAPSRNRQYQLYSVTERPDARSYPVRRLYVRGLVRQLTSPALLAATYTGSPAAVATATLEEIEPHISRALKDIKRLHTHGGSGADGGAGVGGDVSPPDWVNLFFSVLPPVPLGAASGLSALSFGSGAAGGGAGSTAAAADGKVAGALRGAVAGVVARHLSDLREAGVASLELRLRPTGREPAWRLVISLPSGHEHGEEHVGVYREGLVANPPAGGAGEGEGGVRVYHAVTPHLPAAATRHGSSGYLSDLPGYSHPSQSGGEQAGGEELNGLPVLGPYPPLLPLQQRRLAARRHNVTYCYDWPTVFETALREVWAARAAAGEPGSAMPAGRLVEAQELVLASSALVEGAYRGPCPLVRVDRAAGRNDVGMVAWYLTLRTPECPQGRHVIAVANDLTFQSGAFAPREDAVFRGAAELALEERLPLVYLAANSGARVGLAAETRDRLEVAWVDPSDPSKGFEYLYLSPDDYRHLQGLATRQGRELLRCVAASGPAGEARWRLTDVVGSEDGLGVECLSGSGAIASAYNKAFREGYTVTLVSGRTVGIGAYLARLGRRCVQRANAPIVLTGYAALNKLLGRPVYSSHLQLGGPRVMGVNGVSHHVVSDDVEGTRTILALLSFCPPVLPGPVSGVSGASGGAATTPAAHTTLPTSDPVRRAIAYAPAGPGEKLDPRAAIAGRPAYDVLHPPPSQGCEWVSGLFDKGTWLESQAGWARTVVTGRARLGGMPVGVIAVETATQVRTLPADPGMPDTSESTLAQAGQVWYPDSAQKTAASIEEFALEGLPLIILANWRGFSGGQRDLFDGVLQAGSLIVEALRTYAHPVFVYVPCNAELRGGAWVVVDSCINSAGCMEMYADPGARGGVLEPEGVVEIKFRTPDLVRLMHRTDPVICAAKQEGGAAAEARIKSREKALLPVYQQVAVSFADMHDTPVRMLAKGVLRGVVPWASARTFLAGRLRRRLLEAQLAGHVAATDPQLNRSAALQLVREWRADSALNASADDVSAAAAGLLHGEGPGGPTDGAHTSTAPPAGGALGEPGTWLEQHVSGLMADDRAFLEWAESGAGRASLAASLRALRARAATALVTQVLGSQEGREGALAALGNALSRDPGLGVQLRALLARGGASLGM